MDYCFTQNLFINTSSHGFHVLQTKCSTICDSKKVFVINVMATVKILLGKNWLKVQKKI